MHASARPRSSGPLAARSAGWASGGPLRRRSAPSRPDTDTARGARDLVEAWAPAPLVNHSQRTYAFGALLGARDGLKWDAELLYVAAMLHDAGLTGRLSTARPFQDAGAEHARHFGRQAGWTPERSDLTARAIAMHLELGRAARERPEVALLHLGAAADVTGLRLEDIPSSTVAEVVAEFPRLGFKALFSQLMRDEARSHPRSTTAFLCRWGQFRWRIAHAPFDS